LCLLPVLAKSRRVAVWSGSHFACLTPPMVAPTYLQSCARFS
jgi:hypothetical protein